MKKISLLVLLLMSSAVMAIDIEWATDNFRNALKTKVGNISKAEDLKLSIHKIDRSTCDEFAGPSLVADLLLKKTTRIINRHSGKPIFRNKFEKIKSYSVSLAQADQSTSRELAELIVAENECAE